VVAGAADPDRAEIRLQRAGRLLDACDLLHGAARGALQGDRFVLNGRPYKLRLVLDQGYWPQSLAHRALTTRRCASDVELAKAMGFNGVRKHQKIEDPRYLYWADRLGLLVWEEMPSRLSLHAHGDPANGARVEEVIERDYSHPCVIVVGAVQRVVGRARTHRRDTPSATTSRRSTT
jgi:beta-galactosidase/beta-glucuronidase